MIDYTVTGGIGVLRLDAPPVNTITFALLDALRAAIGRANADAGVRGIVVTGGPAHFSAGADVGLFRDIVRAEEAVGTSRRFQEAFQAVEDSGKPVVAAVAGRMMGSALELAMACHYRIAAAGTRFSMPEVTLAINPGAGGTGRLPRLIGPGAALTMLLTGEPIDAERALALGLIDAICDGGELLDRARVMLAGNPQPRRTRLLTEKAPPEANAAAFEKAEERLAGARPEVIAPRKILEAVRTGLEESFQAGLEKEQTGFAECMATPATRNTIYLFFAAREMGKMAGPAGATGADVAKAAIIGMGSMGTGIAHALIIAGVPVVAVDEDPGALGRGVDRIRTSVGKRVEQGKLARRRARAMLGLLSTATDWREIADADLVIEAVFEEAAVKRAVIGQIEATCTGEALVASNTSTLSLDVLAEGMRRPERLVGMHFFNPAHRMPLVEVIRRDTTPGAVLATALGFVKRLRKTPVVVRNREGFLVNRMFIPYLKEAFRLVEEGADPPAIDAAMVAFGFPMGPLALIDMAGLDVLVLTDRVLSRAFPRHGPLSPVAARLVEGGHVGQKSGSGVYRYTSGDRTPHPSGATARIVAEVQEASGLSPRGVGADEIRRRLVLRMVGEAFHVMQEGIAQRESDLDAATVLGMGFPRFRGGVMTYARGLGLATVRADLEDLAARCGERFSPPRLLQEMEGAG